MQTSTLRTTTFDVTTLCAALALIAVTLTSGAPPLGAQAIGFGQEISLQSDHGLFLVAEQDGRLDANREDPRSWEHFRLVAVAAAGSQLAYGDQVALRSAHGPFVVAEADGSAWANRLQVGAWETWTVVNPYEAGSTEIVRVRDAVALRSVHGRYLVAEPDGRANADRSQIGSWETWRIGREWTDFYYDKASSTACTPGECCACPYRGRFDGANCFVARPPVGTAPTLQGREFFYQSTNEDTCVLGKLDGSRCRVGTNPEAPPPFLYKGGLYLSSLCSSAGELQVQVERVRHCTGLSVRPMCFGSYRLTRKDYQPWRDTGVPNGIQAETQLGVVFGPEKLPAKRVALLLSGQQFEFDSGIGNSLTGQPDGFNEGWGLSEPRRTFTLDDGSLAHELVENEILNPRDSFLAVAFDARFNHKFNRENKNRIEEAYFRWLRSKFDPQDVELVYLAGHSRGGCLAMRLAQRLQREMPHVPVVAQSFDGVCNRNQGELGIEFPGRVDNPLVSDNGVFAWPTDLRTAFQNQESSLALLQLVGGHPFFPGDLLVRPFSQQRADQPELDLCWYQQRWMDLNHGQLGGFRVVQPALDHLRTSLERFTQGPTCPAVGRCTKALAVPLAFECNDLTAADCETQTECRLEPYCRHVSGSLTCRDLSQDECDRYDHWCRWRRGRCRSRPFQIFECNDLSTSDCSNHGECRLRQECKRQGGSLTCSDLFAQEMCERYSHRGCRWQ